MGLGKEKMKICVFGLWHLGSVTAACLSSLGFDVVGLDTDHKLINGLKEGKAPLYEPGLNDLLSSGLNAKKLSFMDNPEVALSNADVLWVTFDTPVDENDVSDVEFVERNISLIINHIREGIKIVISSQVPVGFTNKIREKIEKTYPGKKFYFAYSPENLRLGNAIKIFLNPDRIIVGTMPEERRMFEPLFLVISKNIEWMKIESAEMTKHAINAFLATSIVFTNELAGICESTGADIREVERGLKSEERIGPKAYLSAGSAYSGGTLARDIKYLINSGKLQNKNICLFKAVEDSNDYHKKWVKRQCSIYFSALKNIEFAVLGLAYKPGTDTLRRSLAVELCIWLHQQGAKIKAFDPNIKNIPDDLKEFISLTDNMHDAIKNSKCIILTTKHPVFREINKELCIGKIIIDENGYLRDILSGLQEMQYIFFGEAQK